MDRRVVFVIVFFFTFISTALVFTVCMVSGQGWLVTSLYSLVTMWLVGIISQLLVHHLYLGIVKPMDDEKQESFLSERTRLEVNLDEVEEIDEVERAQRVPVDGELEEVESVDAKGR